MLWLESLVYSRSRFWGAFAHSLRESVVSLNLNPEITQKLESNVIKLGSLDVPPSVNSQGASAIRSSIDSAFVFGFPLILLVCATLAVASAAVAWRMIDGED